MVETPMEEPTTSSHNLEGLEPAVAATRKATEAALAAAAELRQKAERLELAEAEEEFPPPEEHKEERRHEILKSPLV